MACLLLVDEPRSGPENMAIDQAMVERAAREGIALARLYSWSVPTLSLGYFQRASDQSNCPLTLGMPVVRRATGGGAIVHHFDWTYSIAIPTAPANDRSSQRIGASTALYDSVHQSVVSMLRGQGLAAQLCQPNTRATAAATTATPTPTASTCGKCSFLCFERRAAGDVLVGDAKVLGSAQRRTTGGLIQHGSLLLATSPHAPALPGLAELAPHEYSRQALFHEFQQAIVEALSRFSLSTVDLVKKIADFVPEHDIFDLRQFGDEKWTYRTPRKD
jgi:lipoyl(octanoyl) transferase